LPPAGVLGRGDRVPDVTGQKGNSWIARIRRGLVGEHELRSLPRSLVGLAGWLPGVALSDLVGPPAGDDGARGRHDLRCLVRVGYSKIQSMLSPGPAMKPSSDIVRCTTTFPVAVLASFMRSPSSLRPPVLQVSQSA
jgi:hypothetical protein